MKCDCHLWLSLPPGGHHERCTARGYLPDGIIVMLLALSAMMVTVLGWMVFG